MEEDAYFLDTLLLLAALALIVVITFKTARRSNRPPVEGQRMAMYGFVVWLGLFGLALYLIFG